jgi:FkbM family methyltransferase
MGASQTGEAVRSATTFWGNLAAKPTVQWAARVVETGPVLNCSAFECAECLPDSIMLYGAMARLLRSLIDTLPPLGRGLRNLRDWRAMASLKRVDSSFGFTFWGGNYLASGIQEPDELSLISKELSSVDVMVDCGANAGLFTCLAASRKVPVIAVEPSALNLSVLYRNLKENSFDGPIEIYPVALGAHPGIAPFYGRGQGASLVAGWGGMPTFDSNLVPILPLDAIMGRRFDGQRILLKIDVEGGEWNLLQGASEVLKQRPRVLMELSFSMNQPGGRHPHFREVLDRFWGMNYQIGPAARPSDLITPSRVDQWFAEGKTDLPGENIWLVPA